LAPLLCHPAIGDGIGNLQPSLLKSLPREYGRKQEFFPESWQDFCVEFCTNRLMSPNSAKINRSPFGFSFPFAVFPHSNQFVLAKTVFFKEPYFIREIITDSNSR
jgi:hypothetical protein